MLKDKDGSRLFRKVLIKVVFPDAIFPPKTFVQHAGPHQGYGSAGVDAMLMQIADHLDTLYPFWEFRAVELKPEGRTAKYVFTFAGYRSSLAAQAAADTGKVFSGEIVEKTRQQGFTDTLENSTQDKPTESTTLEPGTAESNTPTFVGTPLHESAVQDEGSGFGPMMAHCDDL